MAVPAPPPPPLPKQVCRSRAKTWAMAVVIQLLIVGFFVGVAYAFERVSPSFFASVPWRLPLWASFGAYISLAFMVLSCTDLLLPRAPAAVREGFIWIGVCAVGAGALDSMVSVVLALGVEDRRVLLGCTGGVAASIAGLLAFWVWLACKYGCGGGGGGGPSENGRAARLAV